jgi:hypothetical protein
MEGMAARAWRLACALALGAASACSLLVSTEGFHGGDGGPDSSPPVPDAERPDAEAPDAGSADASPDGRPDAALSYAEEVLADEPLAYLRFGEPSGTATADERGTYDGTLSGAATLGMPGAVRGDPNTALGLDGGAVSLGNVFSFPDRAPFSVEVWANPEQLDDQYRNLYSKVETVDSLRSGHFLWVRELGSAFERNAYFGAGGGQDTVPGALTPIGAWSHVVATYDGSAIKTYFNGNLIAIRPSAAALPATSAPFLIGRHSAGSSESAFLGSLDELAIYGRELPAERVLAHYRAAGY